VLHPGASKKRPEIRCRVIRNRLKALELFDSATKRKILDRISKTTLLFTQCVEEDQWVPIEYNVELSEQVAAETGEKGIFDLGLRGFNLSIDSSFIAPFIRAALSLAKVRPNLLVRLAPQFWNSIHRNCGQVSVVEKAPRLVHVLLRDLPKAMIRSRNHMMSVVAFIQAFSPYTEIKGSAALEEMSEINQSAVISICWEDQS
jgi:hypothetical protein